MHLRLRRALAIFSLLSVTVLLTSCCGKFFKDATDLVAVSISPSNNTITPGNTQQFSATGTYQSSSGSTGDITGQTVWTSSDPSVATIDASGIATGVAYGSTTIKGTCGCYDSSVTLTVGSQSVTLTSITVTPSGQSIKVASTQQYTAMGTYSNSTTANISTSVTWSSSDQTVITISSTGLATAKGTGSATIMATSGSVTGSTTVTVQ